MPAIESLKKDEVSVTKRSFKRYLFRLIGVFLLFIFIPIIVIGVLSYRSITQNIEKRLNEAVELRLQQLEAFTSGFLSDAKTVLFGLGTEKTTANLCVWYSSLQNRYEFFSRANQIKLSNPWIASIIFYIPGEFLMRDAQIEYDVRLPQIDIHLIDRFRSLGIQTLLVAEGSGEAKNLIFVFPLISFSSIKDAYLIFFIDTTWFEEAVSLMMPFPLSRFSIFNEEEELVFDTGSLQPDKAQDGQARTDRVSASSGSRQENRNGRSKGSLARLSDDNGWYYLVDVDSSYYDSQKRRVRWVWTVVAVLLLGTGAMVSYMLARIYGNPILKTILDFQSKINRSIPASRSKQSGIHLLEWYLDVLYEEKTFLQSILEENRFILLNGVFRNILEGRIRDSALDSKLFRFAGLEFSNGSYCVLYFAFRSSWAEAEKDYAQFRERVSLIESSREIAERHGLVAAGVDTGLNSIALIVNFKKFAEDKVAKAAEDILQALDKQYGFKPIAVIGRIVTSLAELHISYQGAIGTAELHLFNPNAQIYHAQQMPEHVALNRDWMNEIQSIAMAIRQDNESESQRRLGDFFASIPGDIDRRALQVYCFQLISKTTRELADAGLPPDAIFSDLSSIYLSLSNESDFGAIVSHVEKYIRSALKVRRDYFSDSTGKIVKAALNYISAHYCDPLISLTSISEYIGVSPQYLSTVFKAATQKGFTTHLSLLRLHRSVDLLEKSEETVDQIAKDIGYANRQTFIRKFQEFYGTTPGKYRRLRNLRTL